MEKVIFLKYQNASASFNTQVGDKWLLMQFYVFKMKYYAIAEKCGDLKNLLSRNQILYNERSIYFLFGFIWISFIDHNYPKIELRGRP
jgi:type IV secretory pathway VirB6-like protein